MRRTIITNRARAMRKAGTEPEVILWSRLRGRSADRPTFRRQHPFDRRLLRRPHSHRRPHEARHIDTNRRALIRLAALPTLSALANQTAVALENARLVENLVQLNTELRQAYRALDKANRDLERLDQTKSDFISIASHELRTPLTTIIGYTEMLLEDQSLPPAIHSMLESISKGTRRLHEIMDSMFDIAQIDTRTLQVHLTPVDTASLIQEVSSSLENSVKERKQTLTINIPQMPLTKADPNLLKKLFQHLLTNAIKFTPNDGKISVIARALPTRSAELPHGGVEIVVSDSGVGVDPASQDIIFSKFYQPGDIS